MSAWLGPYRAILSARFRMLLQYRAAALAGLWTQIFFGFVLLMMLMVYALYNDLVRIDAFKFFR